VRYLYLTVALIACSKHEADPGSPRAVSATVSDDGTCGGLAAYVPERVAGLARSRMAVGRHPDVIAELNQPRIAAAYKLSDDSYANVQLGCVDPAAEAELAKMCALNVAGKKTEQVAGFAACVTFFVDHPEEGFGVHFTLASGISVDVTAPTEQLTRQIISELPLAKLAALPPRKS
jgi:hypothetical protein